MKKLSLFIILIISGVLVVAQKQLVRDPNAEVRRVSGFHAIKVSHAIDLQISQSNEEAVAVSASKPEYRNHIKTVVENGVLKIWYDENNLFKVGSKKLRAYVSFITLDKLTASGASDVTVLGSLKANNLSLNLSGASDFKGEVKAASLNVDLSGASDVTINGSVANLKVDASGASQFKGYDLQTDNCTADVSGASDIRITVNKELNASASGASGVYYRGEGLVKKRSSSGASNISKKG